LAKDRDIDNIRDQARDDARQQAERRESSDLMDNIKDEHPSPPPPVIRRLFSRFRRSKPSPALMRLPEDFTDRRVVSAFNFYHTNAESAHLKYSIFKMTQILAGASIPVVAVLLKDDTKHLAGTTAVLGALVTAIESYIQFSQCQQNWIRWRGAAEALVREAFLFKGSAPPYNLSTDQKRNVLLTETAEAIIAAEQQTWKTTIGKPIGKDKDTGNPVP
jgi:hypothetical protein